MVNLSILSKLKTFSATAAAVLVFSGFTVLADWVSFTSREGKFKADFPQNPTTNAMTQQTEEGSMDIYLTTAYPPAGDNDNIVYIVTYTDYPAKVNISSDIPGHSEDMIEGARGGYIGAIEGTFRSNTPMSLGQYKGEEFIADAMAENVPVTYRVRHFLVKSRYYVIQAVTRKGTENNASAMHFLNSFSLTN